MISNLRIDGRARPASIRWTAWRLSSGPATCARDRPASKRARRIAFGSTSIPTERPRGRAETPATDGSLLQGSDS